LSWFEIHVGTSKNNRLEYKKMFFF
jgi:hypothetical protein